ncbi:aspartate carbamoyltransferase [Methylomonas sp. MgM2]
MKKHVPILISLLLPVSLANAVEPADPARLDEVAERGSHVMPFDLEKTLHVFDKTDAGGLQQVVAKVESDSEQIALIRKHLAEIAGRFAKGDFSGPKKIHGDNMPGVKMLSEHAAEVQFLYQDLPNGGQITYRSKDPKLIDAIHRYFDAQLSDHARHAVSGSHKMHHGQQP